MAAVEEQLILPGDSLALLFTPPFDRTPLDPGYIKGYPPELRENGTHRSTRYEIAVAHPYGVNRGIAAALDGLALPAGEPRIRLLDDGATHRIEMILGSAQSNLRRSNES